MMENSRSRKFAILGTVLLCIFIFSNNSYAASLKAGVAAYNRGDYPTALKEFSVLARQGHASAQYNLGVIYYKGLGVPQDYKEAVKWYRRAAGQGYAKAQYNLGLMYYKGLGVPQDYVLAHMWFNLAGKRGDKNAKKGRNLIEREMTPAQVAEAQRRARNWNPFSRLGK